MAPLRKKQIIILTLTFLALIAAFVGFRIVQTNQNYNFIKRAVARQPYAHALTEIKRSSTNECYPGKNEKPVCLQIRYAISQEKCALIKNTDAPMDSDNSCQIDSGAHTYEDGNFRYSISDVDGKPMLYVLLVSKN